MNKADFLKVIDNVYDSMRNLTASKGEEYSRDNDQFANFKRGAADAGITKEQVWQVFFNKHVDSIKSYTSGKVARDQMSERIEDRIDDAILYLTLLRGMVMEDRVLPPAAPKIGLRK